MNTPIKIDKILPIKKIMFDEDSIVNSINARSLHEYLEIKKDFSSWIKNQIKRAGLEINIDYVTLTQKGEGGKYGFTAYLLTLDSAKHLTMMSQSSKAKEVRNYFIKIEKEYILGLQSRALVDANANQQSIDLNNHISRRFIEPLQEQNKNLEKILKKMNKQFEKSVMAIEQISIYQHNVNEILDNMPIDTNRIKKIRKLCEARGRELAGQYNIEIGIAMTKVYSALYDHFNISVYCEIKVKDYYRAIDFIGTISIYD